MSRRFLLVQCCHLPHFFYIAEKLRQENPDAIIDALFPDHPQARFYAERFPIFHRTCSVSEIEQLGEYDAVILPLVNRGYKHLKKTAAKRRLGPLFEVDYSGRLHRLGRLRLFISAFYSGLKPDAGFSSFFDQFPHGLGPERVLLIESCHESLLPKAREELNRVMREHRNVVRVRRAPLRDLLRQFRGQKFDTACVFFSGEKGFLGMKLLPFLLPIKRIVIFNEHCHSFEATWGRLVRFLFSRVLHGTATPHPLPPRIVLFQTETVDYLRQAAERLKQRHLFPHSELILVCHPENQAECEAIPEVNRVLCYPPHGLWKYFRFWKTLNRLQSDLACAVFSNRRVHRWEKALFFCLEARHHLAFNASLECYQVSLLRSFRMFRDEPLIFGDQLPGLLERGRYALLLQTADDRRMLTAIKKLRDPKVGIRTPIIVFCTETRRSVFQKIPGVKAVYTYRPDRRWSALKAGLRLSKLRLDVVAAVLTIKSSPWVYRALFLALPASRRLVFTPDLRPAYLSRWSPLGILKAHRIEANLLIQTADDSATLRALDQLRDPRVAAPAPVIVFCREDKAGMFAQQRGVESVLVYHPHKRWEAMKTVLKLLKFDIVVVAGLFTAEPIFRLQKLLFFAVPARNRLVFNRNLDCYYLNRSTFWTLFKSERTAGQTTAPPQWLVRTLGKLLLFFPRFIYLVIWVTGQKLKRAYSLSQK